MFTDLSLINVIKRRWHLGSVYLGYVFFFKGNVKSWNRWLIYNYGPLTKECTNMYYKITNNSAHVAMNLI
jgi:hypothetical protein